jgi:hypothetical protein
MACYCVACGVAQACRGLHVLSRMCQGWKHGNCDIGSRWQPPSVRENKARARNRDRDDGPVRSAGGHKSAEPKLSQTSGSDKRSFREEEQRGPSHRLPRQVTLVVGHAPIIDAFNEAYAYGAKEATDQQSTSELTLCDNAEWYGNGREQHEAVQITRMIRYEDGWLGRVNAIDTAYRHANACKPQG